MIKSISRVVNNLFSVHNVSLHDEIKYHYPLIFSEIDGENISGDTSVSMLDEIINEYLKDYDGYEMIKPYDSIDRSLKRTEKFLANLKRS